MKKFLTVIQIVWVAIVALAAGFVGLSLACADASQWALIVGSWDNLAVSMVRIASPGIASWVFGFVVFGFAILPVVVLQEIKDRRSAKSPGNAIHVEN